MEAGIGAAVAEGMFVGLASGILVVVSIAVFRGVKKLTRAAKSLPQDLATKTSARVLADSEAEERLYDLVRQEYESGDIRSGLWTKAEATANSTEKAEIRAKYIQLRFEQLVAHGQLHQQKLNLADVPASEETLQKSEPVAPSQANMATAVNKGWGRTAAKIVGSFVVLGLLIGLAPSVWLAYQNRLQVATGMAGIELGRTKADVTLKLGAPDESDDGPRKAEGWSGHIFTMSYKVGMNGWDYLSVLLNKEIHSWEEPTETVPAIDELRVWRICSDDFSYEFSGIHVYSSEAEVIEKFGEPASEIIAEDELSKWMFYGDYQLIFKISEGIVREVCVSRRSVLERL